MRTVIGRGLIAASLLTGAALGVAAPAQAADTDLAISATRLVLEPGERGYTGTYHVTVTNTGDEPAGASVRIVEPVAGSFRGLRPSEACLYDGPVSGRRVIGCGLPGGELAPGEVRKFRIDFGVLTTPRDVAMSAADTTTQLVRSGADTVLATATSRTLFRSTTGVLTRPQPYVQDVQTDLSVTSPGEVTLTRQGDGSFLGTLPVTVRWGGDAPHDELALETLVPEGFEFAGAGNDTMCMFPWCYLAGGPFAPGQTSTLDLQITAPAGTPTGTTGTGTATAVASWRYTEQTDIDPADNTASFRIVVG